MLLGFFRRSTHLFLLSFFIFSGSVGMERVDRWGTILFSCTMRLSYEQLADG